MEIPGNGTLYLVGTPIGNLGDITLRALETLKQVDVIACEDTRESQKLLTHFGIQKPLVSYHEHNQRSQGPRLIEKLQAGSAIALVTDAGMPGISDPGTALVGLAIEAGVPVVAVPGPTAFVTALVTSGLDTRRFVFEGFLPREPKGRRRRLRELANETRTLVFYEAPHRIAEALEDMAGVWGEGRAAAVGRELTKRFEEMRRASLGELRAQFAAAPARGELVIVVAGAEPEEGPQAGWEAAIEKAIAEGQKASDAAKAVAKAYGLGRQEVYAYALSLKQER